MTNRQTPAGAMPVVESATLSQSYPFGPWFAPYRVPRPGMNGIVDPRAVGITFEGEGGEAGASPPAAGSAGDDGGDKGGSGTNDANGAPATGPQPDGDGMTSEAGRTLLRELRQQVKDLAKERDEAKLANASEHEKAIAAARTEGEQKVIDRLHATVRRSAVSTALMAAGVPAGLVPDLSKADEFTGLKVGADDEINPADLAAAVKAHKARVPDAYRPAGSSGSADGGARGGDRAPAGSSEEAILRHYADEERRQQRV